MISRSIIGAVAIVALGLAGCGLHHELSPTDTFKAFFVAAKTGDFARAKRLMSRASVATLEATAKAQNVTPEQMLSQRKLDPNEPVPEVRNERISGSRAWIETKQSGSLNWAVVPFVREDDQWKIVLDGPAGESDAKPE